MPCQRYFNLSPGLFRGSESSSISGRTPTLVAAHRRRRHRDTPRIRYGDIALAFVPLLAVAQMDLAGPRTCKGRTQTWSPRSKAPAAWRRASKRDRGRACRLRRRRGLVRDQPPGHRRSRRQVLKGAARYARPVAARAREASRDAGMPVRVPAGSPSMRSSAPRAPSLGQLVQEASPRFPARCWRSSRSMRRFGAKVRAKSLLSTRSCE